MTRTSLVLAVVLSTGCGTAVTAAPDAGPSRDAAVPVDSPAPAPDAWTPGSVRQTLTIGPFHVESGVEQTLCIAIDLGNATPMMLRAVHTHISQGSHHLVVSRADGTPVDPTPTPCAPLTHGIGQAIFIAESHESELVYPSYAGLPMAAHQVIGLELHMIDVDPGPLDVSGMVDFDLVPVDPAIREVHILFTGDLSLSVPAHRQTMTSSLFPMTPGTDVLAMTTHTHQLGIDATLDITTSAADPGTRVHESMNWSDPPLTLFDPPMRITDGQQVRLTCVFDNPTSNDVHFGTAFDDEMCFFWAYYLDPL
jgi:hypothetical protein